LAKRQIAIRREANDPIASGDNKEKWPRKHFLQSDSEPSVLKLVRLAGIEPTTPWFVAKYSIQLSYSREAVIIAADGVIAKPMLSFVLHKRKMAQSSFSKKRALSHLS
jgi:hypothetical protein